MATPDLNNLPTEDLRHVANGELDKVSTPSLRYLAGQPQEGPVKMEEPSGLAGTPGRVIEGVLGVPDAIASGVSHLASQTLAPPAALLARGKALLTGQDPDAASAAVHQYMEGPGTYHARTPGGKAAENDAAAALAAPAKLVEPAAAAIQRTAEAHGQGDNVNNAAGLVNDVVGSIPVAGAAARVPEAAADVANAVKPKYAVNTGAKTAAQELQEAGYQMRPSDIVARNPTVGRVPGANREAIVGESVGQDATRANQALSTRLIGADVGAPDATKLTPEHYSAAKVGPGKVYDLAGQEIGDVGSTNKVLPATSEALQQVVADNTGTAASPKVKAQVMRIQKGIESGSYKGSQMTKDISWLREQNSDGARAAADALEDEIANQLQGSPTLNSYQAARTQFAKIYDAQDATKGGQIDAQEYARLARRHPNMLTGNSRLVAMAGDELPAVTRMPSAAADSSPVKGSITKTLASVAGKIASKAPGMNILRPEMQERIAGAAPAPGPLPPAPGPMSPQLTPPPGRAGLEPRQLGLGDALAQGPVRYPPIGSVPPPPPGSAPQPPLGQQIQRQMQLRDESLPGRGAENTQGERGPMPGEAGLERLPPRLAEYARYLFNHFREGNTGDTSGR